MKKYPLFLCLFFLLSCAKKTVEVDLRGVSLAEVLNRVRRSENGVESVRGLASVSVRSPDRRVSFNQVTIAEEPNLLRLEALAPFGRTAGMIISDGQKIYVFSSREEEVFDSAEEFDFSLFYPELPIRVRVDNLVNLLLGRLPEKPDYEGSRIELGKGSSHILLTLFDENGERSVLWINPINYRIEKAKINLDGGITATCRFGDFKDFGVGVYLPKRIEMEVDGFSISINYNDRVEVNRDVDRNLFKPRPSRGQI
ncbi:MAG TPA: DUF4292 domain-containing protein [Thermodesulfobacteriota bacterium]|nr:DUF4292 domain-containing protein [Thermodesulfobacteriota bacterium]